MLSAVLIGNNIVNLSASSMATLLATRLWGNAGAGLATGILTLLILVFGEISPKTLATIFAENLSLAYSGVIYLLMKLLTPVIFIVNRLALGFLLLLRIDPNSRNNTMTETELRTIVDVSHEEDVYKRQAPATRANAIKVITDCPLKTPAKCGIPCTCGEDVYKRQSHI